MMAALPLRPAVIPPPPPPAPAPLQRLVLLLGKVRRRASSKKCSSTISCSATISGGSVGANMEWTPIRESTPAPRVSTVFPSTAAALASTRSSSFRSSKAKYSGVPNGGFSASSAAASREALASHACEATVAASSASKRCINWPDGASADHLSPLVLPPRDGRWCGVDIPLFICTATGRAQRASTDPRTGTQHDLDQYLDLLVELTLHGERPRCAAPILYPTTVCTTFLSQNAARARACAAQHHRHRQLLTSRRRSTEGWLIQA